MKTGCYVANATSTLTADQGDYDLDNAMMRIVAWSWTDSTGDLSAVPERISPQELIDLRIRTASSADPVQYVAFLGFDQMMVYPTPASAGTITIYYVPVPTEMSDAAHDPSLATYGGIPTVFHKAIEYYALAEGADYDDDQSSAQGQRYRDRYAEILRDVKHYTQRKGGPPVPARVNAHRRFSRIHHDNSVY